MCVLLVLVVILIIILLTWFVRTQMYLQKCLKKFPGPPNVFFLGCAMDFLGDRGMLEVFKEYQEKYGDMIYARIGPHIHTLSFSNPEFAKTVFLANTNLSKGSAYDRTACWLGEGLLTTPEEKWRAQRKMLMPAFNSQLLVEFIPVFDKNSNILVEKLHSKAPIDSTNIHPLLSLCSLDIICEAAMGVSLNAQQNQNTDYVESVKQMCNIITSRSLSIWKSIDFLFIFSKEYQIQRKCLKIFRTYVDKVLTEKKKERKEWKNNDKDDQSREQKERFSLLDLLLDYSQNQNPLSEDEIRQEVNTFMFAGHDTVTAAMDFFLYEIARHPDIQRLLYEEQKTIFGSNKGSEPTARNIHEMRYLDMVIKESLRMYPPVPVYTRLVTKEFIFDGKVIPEGVLLVHCCYGLHRNEKVFPNGNEFNPSRFEDLDTKISQSFLPFSTGPRNCIGQKFAMYEMKVILSKLIRNFDFSPAEPEHTLDLRAEVVLLSKSGVNVKIVPRTSS